MSDPTELDAIIPAEPQKRDALGQFCFYLHFAILLGIVGGWLLPWHSALVIYLVFVPLMVMQWQFNAQSCVLNNIEGWLRTGKWRNKEVNPEEGAWLLTLVTNATGLKVTAFQIDLLTNVGLAALWLLAFAHLHGLW